MAKFVCKECGFKFQGVKKRCPYCSKDAVIEEQDAEQLIKEVGDILE